MRVNEQYLILGKLIFGVLGGKSTSHLGGVDVRSVFHGDILLDTVHKPPELLFHSFTGHHLHIEQIGQ